MSADNPLPDALPMTKHEETEVKKPLIPVQEKYEWLCDNIWRIREDGDSATYKCNSHTWRSYSDIDALVEEEMRLAALPPETDHGR